MITYINMMTQSIDNAFQWFNKFITQEWWTLIVSTIAFSMIVRFLIMPLVRGSFGESDKAKGKQKTQKYKVKK